MVRWQFVLLLIMFSALGTAADPPDAKHDFRDVEHWARIFDDPERVEWQMPLQVVEFLGVTPGQRVADLGTGTGYFLSMLCAAVGLEGRVYAVDVQPEMVEYVKQREDLRNYREVVVPVLARPDDPRLPEGELDLILVVNTWHHIEQRVAYLEGLRSSLRGSGRVAIIDWREGELPVGPPPEERLPRETVIAEFEQAGWTFDSEGVLLPYQYLLVFEQPR